MKLRTLSGGPGRRALAARAAVLVVLAMALGACTLLGNGLTGSTWKLSAMTSQVPAFQGVVPGPDQERYTITFNSDGTAAIKADCNQVTATYKTTVGDGITIVPGASTMAMCPEDSLGQQFVAALSAAESYKVNGSELVINLTGDGRLEFIAAT